MSTLVPATSRQQNKGVGSKSRQYSDPETCQFASESMQGQRDMPFAGKTHQSCYYQSLLQIRVHDNYTLLQSMFGN
jgi:hypothetical protein